MAQYVSDLSKTAKFVPQSFVYPRDLVPKMDAPICKEIPIIDLSLAMSSDFHDRSQVAHQLLKALHDGYGFQVINHGVSEKLKEDAMKVYKELFNLPVEEKQKYFGDSTNSIRTGLYSGSDDSDNKLHLWRDTFVYNREFLEKFTDSWPEKLSLYRKVIPEYADETRKLAGKIFELIAEGLGLEKQQSFVEKFTKHQTLRANYYPKSPNPSLTMGLSVHHDPNTITLIHQTVPGLQILKDEQWVFVEPLPNAFFVNSGNELQIISNGRFKAIPHQVATNAEVDRLTIGIFMSVNHEHKGVKPENAFISDENPPKYKDYSFEEYLKILRKNSTGEISPAAACKLALDSFLI